MRSRSFASLILLIALLSACVADEPESNSTIEAPRAATAPLLGRADGTDSADYSCQVILREVQRYKAGAGFETTIIEGQTWYVWHAFVDVADSALSAGDTPGLLYSDAQGQWYELEGQATSGAPAGMTRHHFTIAQHTTGPGMTSTSGMAQYSLPLVPFVRDTQGGRHFDHNRVADPLESYRLNAQDQWVLLDDAAYCSGPEREAESTIQLRRDWQNLTTSTLRAGSRIAIAYDRERMTSCHTRRYGRPTWNVKAHVRWLPSGQLEEHPISEADYQGINDVVMSLTILEAPQDATGLELWFEHQGYNGAVCQEWDSNYGQNHSFNLEPALSPSWVGNYTKKTSRASSHPCDDGAALESGFGYDTWSRTRAISSDLCLELWQRGVTDSDQASTPGYQVELRYRFDGQAQWQSKPLSYLDRVGNNARYTISMRAADPFPMYGPDRCPSFPVSFDQGNMSAGMDFYYVVSGQEHRPAGPDSTWRGVYTQYAYPECVSP